MTNRIDTPTPTPAASLFRMLNIRKGLDDMSRADAMRVVERIRNETAAELRTTPSAERFSELCLRIQALDISLDALMGK